MTVITATVAIYGVNITQFLRLSNGIRHTGIRLCVVKLKARREDVEVHLLLQETSGAFSLTKRKEGI